MPFCSGERKGVLLLDFLSAETQYPTPRFRDVEVSFALHSVEVSALGPVVAPRQGDMAQEDCSQHGRQEAENDPGRRRETDLPGSPWGPPPMSHTNLSTDEYPVTSL